MSKVSSTEFVRTPGLYQDQAQREAVIITKHNREHTVILSAAEYHRLKRRDRLVFRAGEVPDAFIEAVKAMRPPEESKVFNHEIDET